MKIQKINTEQAWILAFHYANTNQYCFSIGKKPVKYNLYTNIEAIHFNAPSRNGGVDEDVSKVQFFEFFDSIKNLEIINTNTIKHLIPNELFKKRSILIALLKSSEVIK